VTVHTAKEREREREKDLQSGASQVGNNRGEESKRDERKGRGRAARNIHLEYRRRRTGCGLTRNAHLERITRFHALKGIRYDFYACFPLSPPPDSSVFRCDRICEASRISMESVIFISLKIYFYRR